MRLLIAFLLAIVSFPPVASAFISIEEEEPAFVFTAINETTQNEVYYNGMPLFYPMQIKLDEGDFITVSECEFDKEQNMRLWISFGSGDAFLAIIPENEAFEYEYNGYKVTIEQTTQPASPTFALY